MTFCREQSIVKSMDTELKAYVLKCRSWTCEHCQPSRHSQLRKLAASGLPDMFVTLTTSNETADDFVSAARCLAEAWKLIVKRIKRKYQYEKLEYLAVFEAQKSGRPHLHLLLRCKWIDQKWLSQTCAEILSAPIVDVRRINSAKQAASYVTKYVGKAPGKFGTLKRYWHSRAYALSKTVKEILPKVFGEYTERLNMSIGELAFTMRTLGAYISVEDDWHVLADWGEGVPMLRMVRNAPWAHLQSTVA